MPRMTFTEQLQRIVDQYIEAGEPWPATSHRIAAWAIGNRLWEAQAATVLDLCAEQLSRAMREEYIRDPQGRTVRAKHAAGIDGKQGVLWDDIRTATREHMAIAFRQRRHQIVGDCRQLKADVDSFNENNNAGRPIQLVFDFTQDIAELQSTRN